MVTAPGTGVVCSGSPGRRSGRATALVLVAVSRQRRRAPQAVGGSPVQMVLVHLDLVGDRIQALGERADLGGHLVLVPAQQREPVGLVAGSLPDEVGVAADRAQRHAGGAEPGAEVGVLAGGLLVENASWRWVFFI